MTKGFKNKDNDFIPTDDGSHKIHSSQVNSSTEVNPDGIDSNKQLVAEMVNKPKLDEGISILSDSGSEEVFWEVKDNDVTPELDEQKVPSKLFIRSIDWLEATGDNQFIEKPFSADIVLVPNKFNKETENAIISCCGDGEVYDSMDAIGYGASVSLTSAEGATREEVVNKMAKELPAVRGLIGFFLDKHVNRMGETGWDNLTKWVVEK